MGGRQFWFMSLVLAFGVTCTSATRVSVTTDCANKPADVIFVLDSSNSIWPGDFTKQTSFVRDVVENFDIGPGQSQTRVGVLTFGHAVWKQFDLKDKFNKADLMQSVVDIKHGRGRRTKTADALNFALDKMFTPEAGFRPDVQHVVIVITDGRSQKTVKTRRAANRLHAAKVSTFAIGIGRNLDFLELQNIASKPESDYLFMVNDFNALSTLTIRLARKACEVTTPVTATTTLATTTLRVPSDQSLRKCDGKPADIFIAIDSSGSITPKDFNLQLGFIRNLIEMFDIASGKTRVGIVNFSWAAHVILPLNNGLSKQELLSNVTGAEHIGLGTNTADALRTIRHEGFKPAVTRLDAAKIAIVLTDGLSADEILTGREARFAHAEGIKVFAIGIGNAVDMDEIKDIASDPDDDYVFQVGDFASLEAIKDALALRTCEVKPDDRADVENKQPACVVDTNTDLMFIYDTTAMGVEAASAVSTFLAKVVAQLDLASGVIQVGRVTDNCPTGGNFDLSNKLSSIDFSEVHLPRFSQLLKKVRRNSFMSEYGGRSDATNVAVLFMDANMEGLDQDVITEASLLKKNSEVVLVTLGQSNMITKAANEISSRFHLHANSYVDLESRADDFVAMLCDFFAFDSLDYQIHYVVPV